MTTIKFYRFLGDDAPETFENVYVGSVAGGFYRYSGAVIIEGHSCSFEGPDRELEEILAKRVISVGSVEEEVSGYDAKQNIYWDGVRNVPISEDNEFVLALEAFLSMRYYARDIPELKLVKVSDNRVRLKRKTA